jgi:hypothetical protein
MNGDYPVFEGTIEKIIIECEDSGYCPPAPGQEIKQRLTMRRNGSVSLTRYFSGDYSKVPPTADSKTMRRYSCKPTEKLMEYLAFYFGKPYTPEFVCDGGMWGIELTNSVGKRFTYAGSLGNEIVIGELNISQIARRVLEIDELWMFDGGISENESE